MRAPRERRGNAPVDRFEGEAFDFHKKLREAYLELAEREPQRCVVINAGADPATVAEFVWSAVNTRLNPAQAPLMVRDALVSARRRAEVPHPRETTALYGHAEAEQAFLDAYRGGRMPHAWLIGGPRGIGKATLAYRMARFVFAHPDPARARRAAMRARSRCRPTIRPCAASPRKGTATCSRWSASKTTRASCAP